MGDNIDSFAWYDVRTGTTAEEVILPVLGVIRLAWERTFRTPLVPEMLGNRDNNVSHGKLLL
jgi:hypothetical protein